MSERIGELVEQVRAFPDVRARDAALQLAQAILDLHGEALARLLALLPQSVDEGRVLVERLAADPKIGGVLLLHDLHPLDLATRVRQALENPALRDGAAKVELASVEDGVVQVRLEGRHGARAAIEQAIWEAAPDALQVIVEGGAASAPGFVPLEALLAGSP